MTDKITVTLAQIKKHRPCISGWRKLLKSLGGIIEYGEDTPVAYYDPLGEKLKQEYGNLRVYAR